MLYASDGAYHLLWAVFAIYLIIEIVVLVRRFKDSVERRRRRLESQDLEGDHDRSGPRR